MAKRKTDDGTVGSGSVAEPQAGAQPQATAPQRSYKEIAAAMGDNPSEAIRTGAVTSAEYDLWAASVNRAPAQAPQDNGNSKPRRVVKRLKSAPPIMADRGSYLVIGSMRSNGTVLVLSDQSSLRRARAWVKDNKMLVNAMCEGARIFRAREVIG